MQPDTFQKEFRSLADGGYHTFSWSTILERINKDSYVEELREGREPRRYTSDDGLASNLVTRLAFAQGALWAACVDIFDFAKNQWGPGGLCRFDPKAGRWQRVESIDSRPVRWVTLLNAIDDELWVGFREGSGIIGENIFSSMTDRFGIYQPESKVTVLAHLAGGRWATYVREPRIEAAKDRTGRRLSSEYPTDLARIGGKVVVLFRTQRESNGYLDHLKARVSLFDPDLRTWRDDEPERDFSTGNLCSLIADHGEVLITSRRGVHRFDPKSNSWRLLDPRGDVKAEEFREVKLIDGDLWVAYAGRGRQGVSRCSARTGLWTYWGPNDFGTKRPARQIVPLPNGELWILFDEQNWLIFSISEAEPIYVERDPIPFRSGLGRFVDGNWQFPLEPPPKPANRPDDDRLGTLIGLYGLGNQLICETSDALYAGPAPWKRILHRDNCLAIRVNPTKDGKGIIIQRTVRRTAPPFTMSWEYAVYGGTPGDLHFEPSYQEDGRTLNPKLAAIDSANPYYDRLWGGDVWVSIPMDAKGHWEVGPFAKRSSEHRRVLLSPQTLWIYAKGEIIAIDRKALDALSREERLR